MGFGVDLLTKKRYGGIMNKKAVVVVEQFAEWFVASMGLELAPSKGIRATFDISKDPEGDIGKLEFCGLRFDKINNNVSLDMECWKTIFNKYLSYKGVAGYVVSISEGEKKHFGMQIVIEIGGNDRRYDGIYILEEK